MDLNSTITMSSKKVSQMINKELIHTKVKIAVEDLKFYLI